MNLVNFLSLIIALISLIILLDLRYKIIDLEFKMEQISKKLKIEGGFLRELDQEDLEKIEDLLRSGERIEAIDYLSNKLKLNSEIGKKYIEEIEKDLFTRV